MAQRACQEMNENLRRVTQDKKSFDLKTAAELDDLYRTKINLEERLVELIRYKHTDSILNRLVFSCCYIFVPSSQPDQFECSMVKGGFRNSA